MSSEFEALANDEAMAKFIEENTGEDGVLSQEAAERLLSGDYGETGEEVKPEGGDAPDSADDEQKADSAAVKDDGEDPPKDEPTKAEPEEDKKEPVVKAKDGVHEIPYKVVEDLRSDNKALKEQLDGLTEKLEGMVGKDNAEALADAQEKDEAAGTTKASDALIADLEEEFPEAAKLLKGLASTVEALQADKQQADEQRKEQEAAAVARTEFETELAKLAPNFKEVEADTKFWEFVDGQSAFAKAGMDAALKSGDPQRVADVIKEYETHAADSDKSEDTPPKKEEPKPKADTEAAKKKAEEAVKAAEDKPNARSLTDIPGGNNPAHEEAAAILDMDGQSLLAKMESWSPDKIEQHLSRHL